MGLPVFRMAATLVTAVATTAALTMAGPASARPCLDCEDPELPGPGGPSCPTIAASTDPSITTPGPYQVGQALNGHRGTWSNAVSYQIRWLADGVPVSPVTTTTVPYVPSAADRGKVLRLRVTAIGSDTACTASEYSAPSTTVGLGSAPVPTIGAPSVGGERKVGSQLQASVGQWTPSLDSSQITWSRGGTQIGSGLTYTPVAADRGLNLTMRVKGFRDGHQTGESTVQVGLINEGNAPSVVTAPSVTGDLRYGSELHVVPGNWSMGSASVAYQWLRSGVAIADATDTTYRPVLADLGQTLSLSARATVPGHAPGSTVVPVGPILEGSAPTVVTAPGVSGTPRFGSVLRAVPGTWSEAQGTVGYQWLRSGVAIPGATAVTYRSVLADVGRRLSLSVRVTTPGYAQGSTTVQVGTVTRAAAPRWRGVKPRLKGKDRLRKKVRIGLSKAAIRSAAQAPGAVVTFQWLRNGKAIAGQTKKVHRLVKRDRGKRLVVRITLTQAGHDPLVIGSKPAKVRNKGRAFR